MDYKIVKLHKYLEDSGFEKEAIENSLLKDPEAEYGKI